MDWVAPAAVAAVFCTSVLMLVYWYLYTQEKEKYLAIWTVAWATYLVRLFYDIWLVLSEKGQSTILVDQLPCMVSALLLLWGTYVFFDLSFNKWWFYISIIIGSWLVAGMLFKVAFPFVIFPAFILIGLIYMYNGVLFLEIKRFEGYGNVMVGWALILWGLHKVSYPLLSVVFSVSHWRYFTASALEITVAIGLLIVYFQRVEQRLKIQQERIQQYAAELERSNRELEQFAYVVSHDLKAPLRGIANLSQWLEEDLGPNLQGENRNMMNLLHKRVHRMEMLIEGILQFSRAGRLKHEKQEFDVKKLIDEIVDIINPPPGFIVKIGPNMPVLRGDRTQLMQVISNLVSNAIKHHHRQEGQVSINVRDDEEFYHFTVTDDGPGIASEYHHKVFELFQTLQARDEVESTGVGLAIVKKIIESQRGNLKLTSEAGQGAKFHFSWPKNP